MKFKLVGRMDMLAYLEGVPEGFFHVQHKALSAYEKADLTARKYAVSMHERAYSTICQKAGIPIRGTLLNVLRKTLPGEIDKKTKTRKVDPGWAPFERHRLTVGERDRKQFVTDATWIVERIEAEREKFKKDPDAAFPRFTQNCIRYNRTCWAYDHCRIGSPIDTETFGERQPDYVDESVEEGVPAFNVSRLQDFVVCPRLYKLHWIDGWTREEDDEATALVFGSGIHRALEEWYLPGKTIVDKELMFSGWKPGFDDEAAIKAFREYMSQYPEHDQKAKEVETSGYGELMLQRYFEKYREIDGNQIRLIVGVELEGDAVIEEGEK